MKELLRPLWFLSVCAVILSGCGKKNADNLSVVELVNFSRQDKNAEAKAGHQLKKMGIPARTELIKMLDNPMTTDGDAGRIIQILYVHFPSEESLQVLGRYAARISKPEDRQIVLNIRTMMKANLSNSK